MSEWHEGPPPSIGWWTPIGDSASEALRGYTLFVLHVAAIVAGAATYGLT